MTQRETGTLHFNLCGCALWPEIDGLHLAPCRTPGHEERMLAAARATVSENEIVLDVGPSLEMLEQARVVEKLILPDGPAAGEAT